MRVKVRVRVGVRVVVRVRFPTLVNSHHSSPTPSPSRLVVNDLRAPHKNIYDATMIGIK